MTDRQEDSSPAANRKRIISRLAGFAELDPSEIERLLTFEGPTSEFARGDIIRSEGERELYLLLDGWAASAVVLADVSRQLITANLPGDLLGLPGLAMEEPIDTVVALTPAKVIHISQPQLGALFANSPRLAAIMFLISQEERSLLMERLALTGQASALTNLAALILRLYERNGQVDDAPTASFFMPLTQRELGELIGVSSVHTNSLIKKLRTDGVVSIANRKLTIEDKPRLFQIAGISPWRRSRPGWLQAI